MQLHDLRPAPGSTHRRRVVGRGPGSGKGKNAGRGDKGHKKRGQVSPTFEGGQTPLHRRLPQLRGFKSVNRVEYAVVNLRDLQVFDEGAEVTPEVMASRGMLRRADERVKVLGD